MWDKDEVIWIKIMDHLMSLVYGDDFYEYEYDEKKLCLVSESSQPTFKYERDEWNKDYSNMIGADHENGEYTI